MLFFAMVTYYGYGVLWNTIEFDAHSMSPIATPLIYPQSLWVIGLTLFVVIALLLLIRAVIAFVSGDIATVARLIGSRTVNQEIQQELKGTDDGLGQEGVE